MLSAYVGLTFMHGIGQVYVIGEVGICEELDNVNIKWTGGPEDKGKEIELKSGFFLEHDKDVSLPLRMSPTSSPEPCTCSYTPGGGVGESCLELDQHKLSCHRCSTDYIVTLR